MEEQLSFFTCENPNELEVVKASFIEKQYTNYEELFSGFNHLYAITFSYGLDFIREIIDYFDTVEILLGCDAVVKFDLQTIMAFQTRSLEEIRKYAYFIQRIEAGTLSFRVAKNHLSHQKIFILKSDSGKTRIICGSANFGRRAFDGSRVENITVYENDAKAFDSYMSDFEIMRDSCTQEVVKDSLYINSNSKEEELDKIPFIKEIKTSKAGVILDNENEDKDKADFIYDIQSLTSKYSSLVPKADSSYKNTLVTPETVVQMLRKAKTEEEQQATKQANYPQFNINYNEGVFSFNNKPYKFDVDIGSVKQDLLYINEYYSGFDSFIGDVKQMKRLYFRLMNYMFLSPFIARLRYAAYQFDFATTLFPTFAVINGPKSAGKSAFMDTVQSIMFGRKLGGVSPSLFTKTGVLGLLYESTGVPIHIEDIDRERFNRYAGEVVKYDSDVLKEKLINHPVFVLTSNDIETIKPEYAKRVYYSSVDAQLDNVAAASKHKKMVELRKKINTSFYREYLKRMYPRVMELIGTMQQFVLNSSNENWQPDIFSVSSEVIMDIYRDCGIEVPEYVSQLSYNDYFGHNPLAEKIRDKIIRDWNHNKKAFKVLRKQNLLEINAGEKAYLAERMRDSLPEKLRAKCSGTKVIVQLDEAENFFGISFRNKLF